ncbi:TniB family NTP-binding protein [Paraburkholderia sp. SARCC-3016]|uniref:TniB family NTP-binding protein n=1 Tax=Paraburkholderia sp. SARCC-3016 TaxID=3058611 RepID=UPI002806A5E8|nr:TniB family NTP-binding protein [Paraburkholderia sp. SARCC-3016]MDQ7978039.1 TniB family NTP-binding protein [Paraburkholderia sp. SARCC-3016]
MTYSAKALHTGLQIAQIRIHHTKFKEALDGIGRIVQIGHHLRQPVGASIVAPAGAGKTLLIDAVQRNVCEWPFLRPHSVLVASLKESPTVAQIQNDLLESFSYAIPPRARQQTNAILFNVLADAIDQHDIRLIALDEYQHVFLAQKEDVRSVIIDWTKRLMSRTGLPIVLSGTEMLRSIEQADAQLSTRISSVFSLPEFRNDAEWRGVLTAFATAVREISLSPLVEDYANLVFKATKGTMRLLKMLVIEAAMITIDAGDSQVGKHHLKLAFDRMVGPDSFRDNPFE